MRDLLRRVPPRYLWLAPILVLAILYLGIVLWLEPAADWRALIAWVVGVPMGALILLFIADR